MDAGTSQDVAKVSPAHIQLVRPREAGSGQLGKTSGVLGVIWLSFVSDHTLTHPAALDSSHIEYGSKALRQ